jgi:hypothetical protein
MSPVRKRFKTAIHRRNRYLDPAVTPNPPYRPHSRHARAFDKLNTKLRSFRRCVEKIRERSLKPKLGALLHSGVLAEEALELLFVYRFGENGAVGEPRVHILDPLAAGEGKGDVAPG